MGNNLTSYGSEGVDQQKVSDFIDENLWFMIKISGNAECDKNTSYSGFLRFPHDVEETKKSGVAFYDPNSLDTITDVYSKSANKNLFISGYLWKVKKIGNNYALIGKNPAGGDLILSAIEWLYIGYSALHAGFPTGGSIFNCFVDVDKSIATRQLWFSFPSGSVTSTQLLSGHNQYRDDWGAIGKNTAYGKARFCDTGPSTTNQVQIYPVDLSNSSFSPTPLNDFRLFIRPENYINWYFGIQASTNWTQANLRAPGEVEGLLQSWVKSLSPQDRSSILFEKTKRCSYASGNDFWKDELCRYGCNGDGTPNNITLAGCPEIGQKIVSPPLPNDWLRSELGRAYCKQNVGKCEQVLTSWCQSDVPDPDGKFSDQPYGKKNMCACSWPREAQKQKILNQMPSVKAMISSDNLYTRQVGERILQSQTAYFVCKDPDCVQSAIYKNQEDKGRVCPTEQIQNCITEIKIDAGGNISIAKDIASNQSCQQFYGDVIGKDQLECMKNGGKTYTDKQGKPVCCAPGTTFDGNLCKAPAPQPQPSVCPLGKVMKDGKCVCPFGEDRSGNCLGECKGSRTSKGECCPSNKEIWNDNCLDPCLPPQIRDQTGKCIKIDPSPLPPPEPSNISQYFVYIIGIVGIVLLGILMFNRKE